MTPWQPLTQAEQLSEIVRESSEQPVIVFKLATGEQGAAAALSHTGSLAGSSQAYQAAFDRAGIVVVEEFEALIETASFFARTPKPLSSGVAVVRSANRVGEYTITGPKSRTEIAVNLLNEDESIVAPRMTLDLSGSAVAAERSAVVLAEMWRWLLVAALLVLSGEWWLFARRS